ncbi:MAG: carboxypeptidase-like regulatory domain-containing protein [Acidobacteriota bacterium]|nr:carboxypeptidase-like regulatory domain-containing protein [Acidobacteriota bacterium]
MQRRITVAVFVGLLLLASLAEKANAQSALTGVVKDDSGGVLPGVTVEARSPVLIEKVRTVVTDDAGQYRIVDLRPGVYQMTFTLPGFGTVTREKIELISNFTATINIELRVGTIEETVTVSGATPVVDMQTATNQQVMTKELLESVPTGRSIWAVGATLNGVTLSAPDVGGTAGMQQTYMATHGSDRRDNAIQVDGMSVNGIEGDGAIQNYFNQGMFEEMSFQTSALTAEVPSAGVRLNMIPKDGSNTFRGSLFYSQTPSSFQSDNLTPELTKLGLKAPNRVEKIIDVNFGIGGPVKKDKLWFYSSVRLWGVDQTVTDSFYNRDPTRRKFDPDFTKPTVDDNIIKSGIMRLTYQASRRHKFAAYADGIIKFRGHECAANTFPTAEACGVRSPKRYFTAQVKYTGTLTSSLLVEAGWSENDETYATQESQPDSLPTDVGRVDRITSDRWGNVIGPYYHREPDRHTFSGSMSYVTGAHAAKLGFQLGKGSNIHNRAFDSGADLYQEYNNKVPVSVMTYNTPQTTREVIKYDLGIYVQDSVRFNRLTVNPGLRIELFNTYVPAQTSPAGRFVPERSFAKIENLPSWKDIAPRFGLVYDVFGDSKTAVKVHLGKYMRAYSTVGFAQVYNPNTVQTDRRTWSDLNGDDNVQLNEIGPVNTPFNISGVSNRRPDPDIKRPYQWESTLGVQRELMGGVLLSANWIRRDYRRLFWADNVLTTHNDYTLVNIPNPLNPAEMLPIYNLNVAKRGQVEIIESNSTENKRWYNGFDLGFTTRTHGASLYGGVSAGKQTTVNCQVDDPNSLRFCDQRDLNMPYLISLKLAGTYTLPYGFSLSGSWQGLPGVPVGTNRQDAEYSSASHRVADPSLNVDYNVGRAQIPSLTLTSVTVPLLTPGTKFLERRNQIDVRMAKRFKVKGGELQGQFDVFNLLNSSTILSQTETFGSALGRPTAILQGRLFALGMQLNF